MIQEKNNLASEIKELDGVKIWASMSLYIHVENIEKYYEKCSKAEVVIRNLDTSWYWMKEFVIQDNSWYVIMLGEQDNN